MKWYRADYYMVDIENAHQVYGQYAQQVYQKFNREYQISSFIISVIHRESL